jgi:hypothetical protein
VQGRTFAFVRSLIRITLVAVLAIAPIIAATIGVHSYQFENIKLNYNGAQITIADCRVNCSSHRPDLLPPDERPLQCFALVRFKSCPQGGLVPLQVVQQPESSLHSKAAKAPASQHKQNFSLSG